MTDASGAEHSLEVGGWGRSPHAGIPFAVFLASAALLLLELALTRFFSYTIWYHFAYLTISVALLGFGSSGALVAAFPGVFRRRGEALLTGALVAAAVCTAAGLVFLAHYPIEVRNLLKQPLHFASSLAVYYAVVGAPFLLAGFAISVPFAAYPTLMPRLYFWDLVGAAGGCALLVLLIERFGVPGLILAAAGLLVAAAAALRLGSGDRRTGAVLAVVAALSIALAPAAGKSIPVSITGSKTMSAATSPMAGRSDHYSRWTAINRVDAFGWERPSTESFWSLFGKSTTWTGRLPEVARLTYDGSNGSDIFASRGDIEAEFAMLDHHLFRAPYLVLDRPNVLVIGVGGGIDIFNAIKQGARHVTGAELQPVTVDLLKNRLRSFTGGIYDRDDVSLVVGEGRHFVRRTDEVFDLVQITTVDTFAAQSTGAYVLAESYLYTVEAAEDYLARLSDDGLVSFVIGDLTIPGALPPQATRLALIGARALQARGVRDPSQHIVILGTAARGAFARDQIVLVRKQPFRPEQVEALRVFAAANGFDVDVAPGGPPTRMSAILGPDEAVRQAILDEEWFDVEAIHDTNPFFYNVGKWKNLSPTKTTYMMMPGSFMGQAVLLMMVAQSLVFGGALILLPLVFGAREGLQAPRLVSWLVYFLSVGIGFMFLEISSVQASVLFLGSPTYALSVTILALLFFLGVGSSLSGRFVERPQRALSTLRFVAAALAAAYGFALEPLFGAALHFDLAWRVAIAVLVQLPAGLVLGMFMPLGIACVARENARLVPWAWGINGVGSVVGTTLAVLLAMATGFPTVAFTAAVLYLAGTTILLRASGGKYI